MSKEKKVKFSDSDVDAFMRKNREMIDLINLLPYRSHRDEFIAQAREYLTGKNGKGFGGDILKGDTVYFTKIIGEVYKCNYVEVSFSDVICEFKYFYNELQVFDKDYTIAEFTIDKLKTLVEHYL